MKMLFLITIISLAGAVSAGTWLTNKDHSEILFQVSYMQVSELTGRFNDFEGKAKFDQDLPENIIVTIKASSIDTANKMRDGHLKNSEFLAINQFPEIIFSGEKLVPQKKNHFKVHGVLTIKGISRKKSFDFSISDLVKDTWGYENRFVKFQGTISRKDFGMEWNKTLDGKQLLVGDEVTVKGIFQMQPQGQATPNSKHMIPDTDHIRQRDLKRKEGSWISDKLRSLINGK